MADRKPWFPFYAADWMNDERVWSMTLAERGAYITLLAAAWVSDAPGSLPADDAVLARLVGVTLEEWRDTLAPVVMSCWEKTDGRWVQKRLRAEWKSAERVHARRSKGQSLRHQNPTLSQSEPNIDSSLGSKLTDCVCDCSSSSSSEGGDARGGEHPTPAERYQHASEIDVAWELIPSSRRRAKARFRDAWCLAVREGHEPTVIREGIGAYYESPEGKGRFARGPTRFVTDEGWLEDPTAWHDNGRQAGPKSAAAFESELQQRSTMP